jgi:large conductance mechanosensitive channel
VLTFLLIAAVVLFLIVKPINMLMARRRTEPDVESDTRPCTECLSQIPEAASRCAFCASEVSPAAASVA